MCSGCRYDLSRSWPNGFLNRPRDYSEEPLKKHSEFTFALCSGIVTEIIDIDSKVEKKKHKSNLILGYICRIIEYTKAIDRRNKQILDIYKNNESYT